MPVRRPIDKTSHLYLVDASGFIFRAYPRPAPADPQDRRPAGRRGLGLLQHAVESAGGPQGGRPADPFRLHLRRRRRSPSATSSTASTRPSGPTPPEDLIPQFPLVRRAAIAFGQPALEMEGFEADDLIATYARQAEAKGARVSIVSADKDLMQLVTDQICMLDTVKDRKICAPEVFEKFGVTPDKVIDVQALCGDSVDNVPGVPGIGVKTAAQLITGIWRPRNAARPRRRDQAAQAPRDPCIDHAEEARISKVLVTLKDDVPRRDAARRPRRLRSRPRPAARLPRRDGIPHAHQARHRNAGRRRRDPLRLHVIGRRTGAGKRAAAAKAAAAARRAGSQWRDRPKSSNPVPPENVPFNLDAYETVTEPLASLSGSRTRVAQGYHRRRHRDRRPQPGQRHSSSASRWRWRPDKACYIPLGHGAGKTDLLVRRQARSRSRSPTAIEMLKPLLEDPSVLKIGQNIKYDISVFCASQHPRRADRRHHAALLRARAPAPTITAWTSCPSFTSATSRSRSRTLIGSGKSQLTFDQVPLDQATRYAAEDADVTLRLWQRLKPRLSREGVATVYETQDRPLIPVVADMERAGVLVDRDRLSQLSGEFAQRMARPRGRSPQARRPARSTSAAPSRSATSCSARWASPTSPAPRRPRPAPGRPAPTRWKTSPPTAMSCPKVLLDWRMLSKLRSTYTETLRDAIDANTGRVHTSYSLAGAQTGRLASTDPNLQNIPIRTEEGRKIREAFIAAPGQRAGLGRLLADRAAPARARRRHPAPCARPSSTASTSMR